MAISLLHHDVAYLVPVRSRWRERAHVSSATLALKAVRATPVGLHGTNRTTHVHRRAHRTGRVRGAARAPRAPAAQGHRGAVPRRGESHERHAGRGRAG